MVEQVDRTALLRALKDKLDSGEPGMVFVTPDQGHPFVLTFKDGILVSIYSGNSKGRDALNLFARIDRASYRFNATATPVIMPGTEISAADAGALFDMPVAETAAVTETPSQPAADYKTPILALLREKLMDVMGPFAVVTLDEALTSLPTTDFSSMDSVEVLLHKLAQDIDDRRESARFVEDSRAAVGALYQKHAR